MKSAGPQQIKKTVYLVKCGMCPGRLKHEKKTGKSDVKRWFLK